MVQVNKCLTFRFHVPATILSRTWSSRRKTIKCSQSLRVRNCMKFPTSEMELLSRSVPRPHNWIKNKVSALAFPKCSPVFSPRSATILQVVNASTVWVPPKKQNKDPVNRKPNKKNQNLDAITGQEENALTVPSQKTRVKRQWWNGCANTDPMPNVSIVSINSLSPILRIFHSINTCKIGSWNVKESILLKLNVETVWLPLRFDMKLIRHVNIMSPILRPCAINAFHPASWLKDKNTDTWIMSSLWMLINCPSLWNSGSRKNIWPNKE